MKKPRFFEDKNYQGDIEDEFYTLIQLAREEADIRKKLMSFLVLDDFNRQSILNTWINDLKLKKAPKVLINSLSCLLDNKVAKKALEVLREEAG